MNVADLLAGLRRGQPTASLLAGLSSLGPGELAQWEAAWPALEVEKRREIVRALNELAEEMVETDFAAVLRCCLMQDTDAEVRRLSAEGLWEDDSTETADALLRALSADLAPEVRAEAATSLGQFMYRAELEELTPKLANRIRQALLTAHLEETEPEVRRRALEALAFLSDSRVADLIQQAYQHPDQLMRISALFAMGRNGDRRWRETLIRELANPDPELRFEAVRACGELMDQDLASPVARLVVDPDLEVKLAAVDTLGKIGGELARKALRACQESEDETLREAAVEALAELAFLEEPLGLDLELWPGGQENERR